MTTRHRQANFEPVHRLVWHFTLSLSLRDSGHFFLTRSTFTGNCNLLPRRVSQEKKSPHKTTFAQVIPVIINWDGGFVRWKLAVAFASSSEDYSNLMHDCALHVLDRIKAKSDSPLSPKLSLKLQSLTWGEMKSPLCFVRFYSSFLLTTN